ncbi:hypothetical protein [Diaphorobacter aerolatus]|uniref:Glycosyltransferase family 39 protein n=1 Tax=Diaphorobacter aerolatus TaxID=1288495 RepID=A0A7H0GLM5_9BURK|nr:hypothetical protein [Diaphorobacter aerolatus]QNP49191.1 hypothetical protein H9K75_03510 [Diaphorobacter aerolatus]
MALTTQLLFLLGLLEGLNASATFATCAALWAICALLAWRDSLRFSARSKIRFGVGDFVPPLLMLISVGILLTAKSSGAPGHWDDTSFHLPLARYFLETQSLGVNPWLRYPLFPANANLLFSASLLAGGETFAQIIANAVPLSLTLVGIYGFMEHVAKSRWSGWLACAVFCTFKPLLQTLGFAYIDHLFAMYCWAFVACAACVLQADPDGGKRSALLVCGLLAGTAIGTKLFGVVIVFFMSLALAHRLGRKNRQLLIYLASLFTFGIGWYLRSFVVSNDPVHPAGGAFSVTTCGMHRTCGCRDWI